ncbi:MAG: deoxyribonuclease IV [Myxococcota bacterium]|nr:deoxyribonuclease IV [Myxococcota bacterium]
MLFGAHESVAGGLHLALERARADQCGAVQIFTKNKSAWAEPEHSAEQTSLFREAHGALGRDVAVMAHTSYLINLAADDSTVLARSKAALAAELRRCSALGVGSCVLHPGAHLGLGQRLGIRRVIDSLREVLEGTRRARCRLLLENTAGQGTCLGSRFDEIAEILEALPDRRVGVCFDTQHAFAAGYDLIGESAYERTLADLEDTIGLRRVFAVHVNDSKRELGSRVDRHAQVGEGFLGMPVFQRLANDPRFEKTPAVIEVPPTGPKEAPYRDQVARLAMLARPAIQGVVKGGEAGSVVPPSLEVECRTIAVAGGSSYSTGGRLGRRS